MDSLADLWPADIDARSVDPVRLLESPLVFATWNVAVGADSERLLLAAIQRRMERGGDATVRELAERIDRCQARFDEWCDLNPDDDAQIRAAVEALLRPPA